MLGITGNQIRDNLFLLNGTNLFTFAQKEYSGTTITVKFDVSQLSDGEYVGYTGDVEIYTFSYEDRSVDDGTVAGTGTFRAIKCISTMVDIFEL